eukprot:GILJ01006491.1.p1 GENE.GILJ01006491.1~~GILJ01006491.1.p1  ORF type:complete len:467 (-),score=50.92 GILJ01006491.1:176-1390(-)
MEQFKPEEPQIEVAPILPESLEYYVHYAEFNKRMDEWITIDHFDLLTPVDPAIFHAQSISDHKLTADGRRVTRRDKRKHGELNPVEGGTENLDQETAELEKEHDNATKVKNVDSIELGKYDIDTWYFSPYPEEYSNLAKLYICEFCLKYMKKRRTLIQHKAECTRHHPPGQEIYRDTESSVSVFEVDGARDKLYCQSLCLVAKLFLDHKTLYYDVDSFLFYVLTEQDSRGHHVVGYFSKEKQSVEDNNLACILTLPPFQRKGYGKFLIALSYELSRREGKLGSPERPLSDLGKVSYKSYWTEILLEVLRANKGNMSIKEISEITCMIPDDVIQTLQSLNLIQYWKGQHVISAVSSKVIEQHFKNNTNKKTGVKLEPSKLLWSPPPSAATAATIKKQRSNLKLIE